MIDTVPYKYLSYIIEYNRIVKKKKKKKTKTKK